MTTTRPDPDTTTAPLVACDECARAIALGWWGAIARHAPENPDAPVCVLCGEGAAVHTAEKWFEAARELVEYQREHGNPRHWRDDSIIGLGAAPSSYRGGPQT